MTIASRADLKSDCKEFEKEVLPHLDALYGLGLNLTHDQVEAEDLVQDSLVKAFRFCRSFEPGSNMKAWLFKILTNTFYNRYRKDKNIKSLESDHRAGLHYDRFMSEASIIGQQAEGVLLGNITAQRIREAVENLPEEFRLAVMFCDVYDFTYREISDILDCPVGTVMSRLYRGRRLLQKELCDYAVEQGYLNPEAKADEMVTKLDVFRRQQKQGEQ